MKERLSSFLVRKKDGIQTDGKPKKRLVILGTGWASYRYGGFSCLPDCCITHFLMYSHRRCIVSTFSSLLKSLNRQLYDVTVISPRNHFLFTPLLASTTVGTLGKVDKRKGEGPGVETDLLINQATIQ